MSAPTLARRPFHRPGWEYERKEDGWRMLAHRDGAGGRLISRQGVDHTARFPGLAVAVAQLPGRRLVLDGEVCVFDAQLVSQFHLLGDGMPAELVTPPVFIAFDLLHVGARDLRARTLPAAGPRGRDRRQSPRAARPPARGRRDPARGGRGVVTTTRVGIATGARSSSTSRLMSAGVTFNGTATLVFPNLFAGVVKADHPVAGCVGERRVCLVDRRVAAGTRLSMTLHDSDGIRRRAAGRRRLRRRPCTLPR